MKLTMHRCCTFLFALARLFLSSSVFQVNLEISPAVLFFNDLGIDIQTWNIVLPRLYMF